MNNRRSRSRSQSPKQNSKRRTKFEKPRSALEMLTSKALESQ